MKGAVAAEATVGVMMIGSVFIVTSEVRATSAPGRQIGTPLQQHHRRIGRIFLGCKA